MKDDKAIEAIRAADAAGTASGFKHGIAQVAQLLRNQSKAWDDMLDERKRARRWWHSVFLVPLYRYWRSRIETRAASEAALLMAAQLEKSISETHVPEAEARRTQAASALSAALAKEPLRLVERLRSALGGAA